MSDRDAGAYADGESYDDPSDEAVDDSAEGDDEYLPPEGGRRKTQNGGPF